MPRRQLVSRCSKPCSQLQLLERRQDGRTSIEHLQCAACLPLIRKEATLMGMDDQSSAGWARAGKVGAAVKNSKPPCNLKNTSRPSPTPPSQHHEHQRSKSGGYATGPEAFASASGKGSRFESRRTIGQSRAKRFATRQAIAEIHGSERCRLAWNLVNNQAGGYKMCFQSPNAWPRAQPVLIVAASPCKHRAQNQNPSTYLLLEAAPLHTLHCVLGGGRAGVQPRFASAAAVRIRRSALLVPEM